MNPKTNDIFGVFRSPVVQFGRKVLKDFSQWASPSPLSPISQPSAKSIIHPGGLKQAVNNVVALGTLRPELVRKFPRSSTKGLISPVVESKKPALNLPNFADVFSKVGRIMNPPRSVTPTPIVIPTRIPTRVPTIIPSRMPTATPTVLPTRIPLATSTPAVNNNLIPRIQQGFSRWSGVPVNELLNRVPITQYIPQMAAISQEYGLPPWLFPVLSILESSGGQNVKYPTNPFNWGVRQGYNPASVEEAMKRMAYSFTTRPDVGLDYSQRYQIPLRTGNYQKFFEAYEPPTQNPSYWKNAQNIIKYFQ